MDDKIKLINALKEAIAEVDKLIKAWDNMTPTHLEYRQRNNKFQPIRVYRMPENTQIAEITQYTSGDYTLSYIDRSSTASETDSILKKVRELNLTRLKALWV